MVGFLDVEGYYYVEMQVHTLLVFHCVKGKDCKL